MIISLGGVLRIKIYLYLGVEHVGLNGVWETWTGCSAALFLSASSVFSKDLPVCSLLIDGVLS